MSVSVSISGRGEADLAHQYRWYLENGAVEVAGRFLAAFDATIEMLAQQPGMAHPGGVSFPGFPNIFSSSLNSLTKG